MEAQGRVCSHVLFKLNLNPSQKIREPKRLCVRACAGTCEELGERGGGDSDETETPEGALLGYTFIINPKKQQQTGLTDPEESSC